MVKMGKWEKEKERKKKRKKNEGEKEKEKQRRSVVSPMTTDSCDIVEMGEVHGYGERMGKEIGGKKEGKKNGEWQWQRNVREKCDLLGFFEMNGRDEIRK